MSDSASDFDIHAKERADAVAQNAVKQAEQLWRLTEAPKIYKEAFAIHMSQERVARDTEVINAKMDEVFARKAAGTLRPEDIAYAKRILDATKEN